MGYGHQLDRLGFRFLTYEYVLRIFFSRGPFRKHGVSLNNVIRTKQN